MKRKLQNSGETVGTVLQAACVISASVALSDVGSLIFFSSSA